MMQQVARQATKSKGPPYSIGVPRSSQAHNARQPDLCRRLPIPPGHTGLIAPLAGLGSVVTDDQDNHPHQLAAIWPPTSDVAREAGHGPQSPLRAIRAKCRDCSCYQTSEVRLCEAVKCPLWPFRAGKHLWIVDEGEKNCQILSLIPTGKPPSRTKGRTLSNSPTPIGC